MLSSPDSLSLQVFSVPEDRELLLGAAVLQLSKHCNSFSKARTPLPIKPVLSDTYSPFPDYKLNAANSDSNLFPLSNSHPTTFLSALPITFPASSFYPPSPFTSLPTATNTVPELRASSYRLPFQSRPRRQTAAVPDPRVPASSSARGLPVNQQHTSPVSAAGLRSQIPRALSASPLTPASSDAFASAGSSSVVSKESSVLSSAVVIPSGTSPLSSKPENVSRCRDLRAFVKESIPMT